MLIETYISFPTDQFQVSKSPHPTYLRL